MMDTYNRGKSKKCTVIFKIIKKNIKIELLRKYGNIEANIVFDET